MEVLSLLIISGSIAGQPANTRGIKYERSGIAEAL